MLDKRFLFVLLLLGCHHEKLKVTTVSSPDFDKAMVLYDEHPDSAFYYFNKVATSAKDSLLIARAYNNMAELQTDAGDYFGSQETVTTSLKFLNERKPSDRHCLSANYNELGINSFNLKNYIAAIGYYDLAVKFSDGRQWTTIYLNNKANAYQHNGDYRDALKIYRQAVTQHQPSGIEYARLLTNMATTKWLQDPRYSAVPELMRALAIRLKANDRWGQNSSYNHLADYYTGLRPDSALFYAKKMYAVASSLNSPDDRMDALQKLVQLSSVSKNYFAIYLRLKDSVQTARNAAKNQFALIRYDTEKAKLDNLRLQKDNTDKRYQILQRNLLAGALALLVIIGWLWYRKREQRIALSFSQKVHDEVANGLYRVMKRVENEDSLDRESLLDDIETLYERSRDISYEKNAPGAESFDLQVNRLLADLAGDIKVAVVGNAADFWEIAGDERRKAILQVLQELMVNMRKHSGASFVSLNFRETEESLELTYQDNGRGFAENFQQGNGMRNTVSRMQRFGGTVTFGNKEPGGARVHIILPFS